MINGYNNKIIINFNQIIRYLKKNKIKKDYDSYIINQYK